MHSKFRASRSCRMSALGREADIIQTRRFVRGDRMKLMSVLAQSGHAEKRNQCRLKSLGGYFWAFCLCRPSFRFNVTT
jgi:hypothetical protein